MGLDLQCFIVLNGVSVGSNDRVTVCINAAAVFEGSTLCLSQRLQRETHHRTELKGSNRKDDA